MERTRNFYKHCQSGSADLEEVCGRRLAGVAGLSDRGQIAAAPLLLARARRIESPDPSLFPQ